MKSEGALQQRMRELTRKALLALIAVIAVVSVWTPLEHGLRGARSGARSTSSGSAPGSAPARTRRNWAA
jgi:cytochrome bd-type quinol oxidase subunit 2